MSGREIAFTRRPVKDKGALMQTLHLRFRDLRAILLGEPPSRWPTPSLRAAATWKGALPLPNLPRPTLAVGAHPFGGETLPRSLSENAASPSHQRLDRCPTLGAGLTMVSPFREPCVVGPVGANTSRVCWAQTAKNNPHPAAHHKAGQVVDCSLQDRVAVVQWTASNGLSFPLRPQRCGARACGEKTADLTANVVALAGVSSGASSRCLRLCSVVR